MMPTQVISWRRSFRGYFAMLCSKAGTTWLLYIWAFAAIGLTNSIFTAANKSYPWMPDLSIPTWWAYIGFSFVALPLLFADIFMARDGRIYADRFVVLTGLYCCTAAVSILANRGHVINNEPYFRIIKLVIPCLFAFAIVQKIPKSRIPVICRIFTVLAFLSISMSFVEMFINRDNLTGFHTAGIFGDRNLASRFLVIINAYILIEFLASPVKRLLSWKTLGLSVIFVNIAMLFSRSGYLVYIFANSYILWNYRGRRIRRYMPLILAAAIVLFSGLFIYRFKKERMDINNASDKGRISTILAGINMVKSSPAFGVGYGMSAQRFKEFQDKHYPGLRDILSIHNIYLNISAEQGVVGLLPYLLLNMGLIVSLYKSSRKLSMSEKKIPFFCMIALAVQQIHGLVYHCMDYEGVYWITVALGVIALRQQDKSTPVIG